MASSFGHPEEQLALLDGAGKRWPVSRDRSHQHSDDHVGISHRATHLDSVSSATCDTFINAIKYPGFKMSPSGEVLAANAAANREMNAWAGVMIFDLVLPKDRAHLRESLRQLLEGERIFPTQALLAQHVFVPAVLHLSRQPDGSLYGVVTPGCPSASRQIGAQQTKILDALKSLTMDSLVRTLAHSLRRWTQSSYVVFVKTPPQHQSILRVLSVSFAETSQSPKLVVDFLQRKIPRGGIETLVNACVAGFGFSDSLITEVHSHGGEVWGYVVVLENRKTPFKSVRNLISGLVAKASEVALVGTFADQCEGVPSALAGGVARATAAVGVRESARQESSMCSNQAELRKTISNLSKENRALLVAKSAAESSASHQHTLLANISHEIRTPLSGIAGIVSLLEYTELSETQRTYVSALARSVESMTRIVNDCFDLSVLRSDTIKLKSEPIALMPFLREICLNHRVKINEKGLRFCVVFPIFEDIIVNVDRVRMRQVVDNLITNAVKFTTTGGITIEIETEGDSVTIAIRDTGRGISHSNLENVFKRFFQESSVQENHTSGLGIGLTISRQLVELMNGTIRAQNNTSGVGSSFEVSFPIHERRHRHVGFRSSIFEHIAFVLVSEDLHLAECATAATSEALHVVHVLPGAKIGDHPEIADLLRRDFSEFVLIYDNLPVSLEVATRSQFPFAVREIRLSHNCFSETEGAGTIFEPLCWDDIFSALRGGGVAGEEFIQQRPLTGIVPLEPAVALQFEDLKRPAPGRPRVLVAEDDEINQFVLRQYLQKLGFEADVASNGREALKLFEANPHEYTLYIFDCMMPELDGLSLTRSIRAREQSAQESRRMIIALTADAIKGREERCVEAGFDVFLTKPIKLTRLSEVLQAVTARQKGGTLVRPEVH